GRAGRYAPPSLWRGGWLMADPSRQGHKGLQGHQGRAQLGQTMSFVVLPQIYEDFLAGDFRARVVAALRDAAERSSGPWLRTALRAAAERSAAVRLAAADFACLE